MKMEEGGEAMMAQAVHYVEEAGLQPEVDQHYVQGQQGEAEEGQYAAQGQVWEGEQGSGEVEQIWQPEQQVEAVYSGHLASGVA